MWRTVRSWALMASFSAALLAGTLNAGTPLLIPHQGRLLDATDTPLEGVYTITYSIFEVPSGGSSLWSESHVSVVVADGLFSVMLGSVVPLTEDIIAGASGSSLPVERYLEIQLIGQPPISPRTRLGSSPYSVAASRVSGDILTSKGLAEVRDFSSLTDDAVVVSSNSIENNVTMRSLNGLPPGTPVIGALSMKTTPSSSSLDIGDLDGDGVYQVLATADSVVREITVTDNGPGGIALMKAKEKANRTKCSSNLRAIGMSTFSEIDESCDLMRATMKAIQTKGTGAIALARMDAGDSAGVELSNDEDGDGNPEATHLTHVRSGGIGFVDIRSSFDSDDDGVPESSLEQSCRAGGTTMKAIQTKGTGAIALARMDAGDSATISTNWDSDGVGEPESSMEQSSSSGRTVLKGIARSGSTTGTIRMQATPDSALTVQGCDMDGDGIAESSYRIVNDGGGKRADLVIKGRTGSTTGTIRMAANPDSAISALETDADNDGLSERFVHMNAGQDELSVVVEYKDGDDPITHKRAGKQSASAAGAQWSLEDDSDGNGNAECRAITQTGPSGASQGLYKKGLNAVNVSTALVDSVGDAGFIRRVQWDIDNDGTYDMVSSSTGDASGTRTLLKGGMSGSTTGTIRMAASPDSATSSLDLDSDGDGVPESTDRRTISANDVHHNVIARSGSTTGTIRMQATPDSTSTDFSTDADGDGHSDSHIRVQARDAFGNLALASDSDDDGVADVSAEMETSPDSASFRLNGLPPGVPVISSISMTASPSGVNMTVGAATCDGTNWVNASDKNSKENFEKINGEEILEKISDLEITKWNYKGDDDAQHIGPTAQDFKRTFGVGSDDKSISTIDPSGIALAAIKELYKQFMEEMKQKDAQIEQLQREMKKLRLELQQKN